MEEECFGLKACSARSRAVAKQVYPERSTSGMEYQSVRTSYEYDCIQDLDPLGTLLTSAWFFQSRRAVDCSGVVLSELFLRHLLQHLYATGIGW